MHAKNASPSETDIPDFRDWTTQRLRFLLRDYRESLFGLNVSYSRFHPEVVLYRRWIAALEKELLSRSQ